MKNQRKRAFSIRRAGAALLAAATICTSVPTFGAAVAAEQQVLFYNYTANTLLPEYGYANRDASKMKLSADQVNAVDDPIRCWDNDRQGLVSANCVDLNNDGTPELLVTYLAKDPKSKVDSGETAMYAAMYSVNEKWDGVEWKNTIRLFGDNNTYYHYCLGGLVNIGDRRYLLVQEISNAYFADGHNVDYVFYSYNGEELREYFRVAKTDGGTSGIAYKLVKTAADGTETENLLWADGEYLAMNSEAKSANADAGTGLEAGFSMLGLAAPKLAKYADSDLNLYNNTEETFPTYFGTDVQKDVFEYVVSGTENNGARDMTVTLTDYSNLEAHLTRRGIDFKKYIDYPETKAEEEKAAAEKKAAEEKKAEEERKRLEAEKNDKDVVEVFDETAAQIFPDSSDRILTAADIKGKTWDDLRQGINEIYARHGYTFKTKSILTFFRSFSWYEEKYSNQNDVYNIMNKTERTNVNYLNKYVDISNSRDVTGKDPDDFSELVDDTDVVG
ncbi:MAG: YARHG domain-containing protein [Lachnospiraceae bacterium]|nr:YARHG domain-containing protein [Lachnospiraceae bacterium]